MQEDAQGIPIELFSSCPPSSGVPRERYIEQAVSVARWSEEAGCRGILVYTDNSLLDPWVVSQILVQETTRLCPLVAIQPIYMHPYTIAKMVTSIAYLYGRRVYLNMVAGGFKNDLKALNDPTPHDKRYQRLIEYTTIIQQLLEGASPVGYTGEFYSVHNLTLSPPIPRDLLPGIFVSGSSEAGVAAARVIAGTAIQYPEPAREYARGQVGGPVPQGIRLGIISRKCEGEAWEVAHARFPEDRKGQLAHQLAMKVSDSAWHRQLSEMAEATEQRPYWLVPFLNFKTFCPYLVGSYDQVAEELAGYVAAGFRTFILDVPASREELTHIAMAFQRCGEVGKCLSSCTNG